MDLIAMLPWWGGVALALASYLVLHQFSVAPKPGTFQPGQMQQSVVSSIVHALAYAGQFAIPFLCLIAALISFLKRRRRIGLIGQVTQSSSAEALNLMSWREFEMLVGEAFRMQGYTVTEHGGAQADGGVDILLRKGTETFLVQCKQWKALKVGVDVVRELYGVMAARGAAGGFVVTSGSYTDDAQAFADGRNIMLVNGPKLFGLITQAKASLGDAPKTAPPAVTPTPLDAGVSATPQCPTCNSVMVRRTAQKGSNAGSQFWGCSRFPACRGKR